MNSWLEAAQAGHSSEPAPLPIGVENNATSPGRDFDVSIRRIDRNGPGGATQVWLHNTGPHTASGCVLSTQLVASPGWRRATAVSIQPRTTTLQIVSPHPKDADLELRVVCEGEPADRAGNNAARFP